MMATDLNSHYANQPKPFLGVRFVLFGFSPINQLPVKSNLVNGGGVDDGKYSQDCTHVIVNNLIYDDPVCVLAREDGKIVVTGLWVDHSFDIGIAVDHTSIMYRPLKDLNGIPDAKSLIMCLTGYQRQDRDDVMTMVGLMGAQFSKPLVANKVTHLICYKCEGEKYELAKKMKRIKLVNHKWLEDCLSCWQILPESNYSKCGYELEMEIEAKDSEEEAEDNSMQFKGRNVNCSPHSIQTPIMTKKLLTLGVMSTIPVEPIRSIGQSNVSNQFEILSVMGKDVKSGQASSLKNLNKNHDEGLDFENTLSTAAFAKLPEHYDGTPISKRVENDIKSTSISAKKSSLPSVGKSTSLSYSRKTPEGSTFQTGDTRTLSSLPKLQSDELKSNDGFNISSYKAEPVMHRNEGSSFHTPRKVSGLIQEIEFTGLSPLKRKINASCASSKSQKTGHDSIQCTSVDQLGDTEAYCSSGINKVLSVYKSGACIPKDGPALPNSAKQSPALGTQSISYKRKSFKSNFPVTDVGLDNKGERARQNSFERVIESSFGHQFDSVDTSNTRNSVSLIGENNNAHSKPYKKKTLGSIPKLGKSTKTSNLKGSLHLDITATQNDSALCLAGGNQTVRHVVSSSANKREVPACLIGKETLKETNTEYTPTSGNNIENKHESLDDETEAPDDKEELEKAVKMSSALAEVNDNQDIIVEERPEEYQHMTNTNTYNAMDPEGDGKNEVASNDNELKESNRTRATVRGKKSKGVKRILKKSKIKMGCAITISVEHERNGDDAETEMISGKPQMEAKEPNHDAKTQSNEVTVKELEKTMEVGDGKNAVAGNDNELEKSNRTPAAVRGEKNKGRKSILKKSKTKTGCTVTKCVEHERNGDDAIIGVEHERNGDDAETETISGKPQMEEKGPNHDAKTQSNEVTVKELEKTMEVGDGKNAVAGNDNELEKSNRTPAAVRGEKNKGRKSILKKSKTKTGCTVTKCVEHERNGDDAETEFETICGKPQMEDTVPNHHAKTQCNKVTVKEIEKTMEMETENPPMIVNNDKVVERKQFDSEKAAVEGKKTATKTKQLAGKVAPVSVQSVAVQKRVNAEPMWFLLSGHRLQKKEFQKIIKHLRGRLCRDSHQWSYQATHFIVPEPLRRTEKFFAAAASGRWILKSDYLSASSQAGKLLEEEPYEWHKNGLNEDGAINMEAPRKWRFLREKTGHGAFYGMRIIIYGECIAPPLDTLKRAVKAGDGTILATSQPYTRFLKSGVDFAIVSPGMPRVDIWVQEFLKHEIPCVAADYLVEYVCKPGYSLEKHVQYNTHSWAEKSLANLMAKSEEIVEDLEPALDHCENDIACQVCGSSGRGEVMLICGDETGSVGCGNGTHTDCCDPPLEDVPEEDWFCLKCRISEKDSSHLKSITKKVSKSKS